MQGLHDRAGTASLVVIAKGQWEDNGQPMCFHTGLGADFLEQVCKMSLIEFMWRFDAFCSSRGQSESESRPHFFEPD